MIATGATANVTGTRGAHPTYGGDEAIAIAIIHAALETRINLHGSPGSRPIHRVSPMPLTGTGAGRSSSMRTHDCGGGGG